MATFAETIRPCPFGFFDTDPTFQTEADGMVVFVKRRLGDDVLSVELTKKQIWACFEEACTTYAEFIHEMRIQSELINVLGLPTGSDLTNVLPQQSMEFLIRQGEPYAAEAGIGGPYNAQLGYIDLIQGQQDYDLYNDVKEPISGTNMWLSIPSGSRGRQRVLDVFHFEPLAAQQFLLNASNITNFLATNFNYESYVNSSVFYVLPVFEDVLRRGMLEEAFRVRRSQYSHEIMGRNLRIYPIPTSNTVPSKLWLRMYPSPSSDPTHIEVSGSLYGLPQGISGPNQVPFGNLQFSTITQPGRNWIRQLTLALCRETLGLVRGKFKTIPIPNAELTLNGDELVTQGREDQQKLKDQLREWLSKLTNQALLEARTSAAGSLNQQLKFIPFPSGKSITIG
jgi:hypothetical protein